MHLEILIGTGSTPITPFTHTIYRRKVAAHRKHNAVWFIRWCFLAPPLVACSTTPAGSNNFLDLKSIRWFLCVFMHFLSCKSTGKIGMGMHKTCAGKIDLLKHSIY